MSAIIGITPFPAIADTMINLVWLETNHVFLINSWYKLEYALTGSNVWNIATISISGTQNGNLNSILFSNVSLGAGLYDLKVSGFPGGTVTDSYSGNSNGQLIVTLAL